MRRLLGTYLALCALLYAAGLCFAQLPLTHAGKGAPAASCAGFTVDGAATSQPATGSTTSTQTITTTHANEEIFSIIVVNGANVTSTSDTASVFSATTPRKSNVGGSNIYETVAFSSGTLSGDTITTTYSVGTSFIETIVFGVAGIHVASPFDSGGSSNVPVGGAGSPISITTNNANTLILGFFRDGGQMGPQATWTQIAASAGFTLAQFKQFSSAQPSLSVSDPSTNAANGSVGDALVCGP